MKTMNMTWTRMAAVVVAGTMGLGSLARAEDDAKTRAEDEAKRAQELIVTVNALNDNDQDQNGVNQARIYMAQADAQNAAERAAIATAQAHKAMVAVSRKMHTEKGAYLGVVATPVTAAMREQLKLPKGIGLVVDGVQSQSPAESAGIKQYDIIQKIDDQWLVNPQQFGVLVRMHKPGEEVTVTLLRQGQPQTITAKLIEKELTVAEDTTPFGFPASDVFGEQFAVPEGKMVFAGPMKVDFDDLLNKAGNDQQTMTMSTTDDQYTLTLTVREGKKHLTAIDKRGEVAFNGPIDTDEQRKAIPPDIAAKLDKLESKPHAIRFQIERSIKNGKSVEGGATTRPSGTGEKNE